MVVVEHGGEGGGGSRGVERESSNLMMNERMMILESPLIF